MCCAVCDIVMVIMVGCFITVFFFISLELCHSECYTYIKIPLMSEISNNKMFVHDNGGNFLYPHADILCCRCPHCHENSLLM
jgi:hypothetical protein